MMNNPMLQMMQGMVNMSMMNNPMFHQAQQMAQGKSPDQLKQVCMNICKQKGLDFDQAWKQFQSQFPGLR